MSTNLAPVLLFVYNRLWHTQQTVESLQLNELAKETELFIFSDAPKNVEAVNKVEEVRKYIKQINGFKKITIIEREENWGLAKSIVNGVTQIIKQYGKVIVLEDDIVTSKLFLKYMNAALDFYKGHDKVMHIAGYFFPIKKNNLPSTFFYNANSCWGWATWERAWEKYNHDVVSLYRNLKDNKKFNQLDYNKGQGREFYYQLKQNLLGKMNTWAVRWHTSIYLHGGYCLHPKKTLIQNIGIDGTGHNSGSFNYKVNTELSDDFEFEFNPKIAEDTQAIELVKKYYHHNLLNKIRQIKRWIF